MGSQVLRRGGTVKASDLRSRSGESSKYVLPNKSASSNHKDLAGIGEFQEIPPSQAFLMAA
jgi:hypothetical protein